MQLGLKGIDWPPRYPRVWNLGREYSCRRGAKLRDGQPLKPGNYVIADNKISMCSERCGRAGAAANWFTAQRPVANNARLDLDTVDGNPSARPRRPRPQNDAALHEAVRAHWREVVRRARPVDDTARLDLDADKTARLDPETVVVEPSAPPRRPRPQNVAAPHEAVRARGPGGDVVRRARPVDDTARLDLDADSTARLDPETVVVEPSAPPRRPRPQNVAALHEGVRARGRGGDVVRRARPVDSAARLRRGPVKPSVAPRRPRQQNPAALHEAVTVDEATLWRLRIKRTAVAFGAVLLFVALVVFGGRPFGGDDQPAPQPSVPSAAAQGKGESGAVPPVPGAHPEGASGGALPPAEGVQAFSGNEPPAQPMPRQQSENPLSWQQLLLSGVL